MTRPTGKVTDRNHPALKAYIHGFIQRQKKRSDVKSNDVREVERTFNALPDIDFDHQEDRYKIAIDALQTWIDQYAAHLWPKFLALQRQRTFKRRKHLTTLNIHLNAYIHLKSYAKRTNLSLSDAIEKLARMENDRLD